jgi:hypothetical protein
MEYIDRRVYIFSGVTGEVTIARGATETGATERDWSKRDWSNRDWHWLECVCTIWWGGALIPNTTHAYQVLDLPQERIVGEVLVHYACYVRGGTPTPIIDVAAALLRGCCSLSCSINRHDGSLMLLPGPSREIFK